MKDEFIATRERYHLISNGVPARNNPVSELQAFFFVSEIWSASWGTKETLKTCNREIKVLVQR